MEIFLCKQFYIHRSYFYRKLMHVTSPGGNFCLSMGFMSSTATGKNSLHYLSEVFFLLFTIYSSCNLCCLYSPTQPTPLFSRIYSYLSDALAPSPLSQDCQSIPTYCLTPYHDHRSLLGPGPLCVFTCCLAQWPPDLCPNLV